MAELKISNLSAGVRFPYSAPTVTEKWNKSLVVTITKSRGFSNTKVFVLALQAAFIICFFSGIFWHHPVRIQVFDQDSWYYINRGYPVSWAGVSNPSFPVDFPVVKALFLMREVDGGRYEKVIDLGVFLPLFLVVLLMVYPITLAFFKAVENNRLSSRVFVLSFVLFTLGCIFSYFIWFPIN